MNTLSQFMEKVINLQVINLSKIGTKLFIIILLMSIGGLLAAALIINYQIDAYFSEYVYQEQVQELQGIKELIENNYQQDDNWTNIQNLLENYIHGRKVIIKLIETNNNEVIFSNLDRRGYGRRQNNFNLEDSNKIPIENEEGIVIANLYWNLPGQNRFDGEQSSLFMKNVNNSIFWIAVSIVILTVIVSFFFSRYFTRPLLKMNKLTSAVAEGNYNHKINVRGNDEISELGQSLNKMTSRLNYLEKTRDESTGDLAHELRTPLSIISNYLTAIKDGVLPGDENTFEEIEEEIKRLLRLVNRLEDLAETEKKILNLNKKIINFKSLLKKVTSLYRKEAEQNQINLNLSFKGDNFKTYGDKDALKTIIVNLLVNAIKYTPENGHIDLRLENKSNSLIFKVKNNGKEIPEKDLPYIFSRFYRTDKSRSKNTGGVGLGLTITRKLVKAHQGKISAKSNNGVTVFTVNLKIASKNIST